jgi:hypothetical protein
VGLNRLDFIAYRSSVATPDTAEAMRHVERNTAKRKGVRLAYKGTRSDEANWRGAGQNPHLSLRPTGREVRLRLHLPQEGQADIKQAELALLWGIVVPLGFTPWNRYPVPGPEDDLFHFLGPWQGTFDHLCGEGRGELAWPSVCCAAQCDVGVWEGDRRVERFVQSQLHRLGLHCGPVDGIIGDRTAMALQALGVTGMTLEETAVSLAKYRIPVVEHMTRRHGHIILAGDDVTVLAYGQVATMRTPQGIALTVDGPGKVILDIGQEV